MSIKPYTRPDLLRAATTHAAGLTRFLMAQVADPHDAQDLLQEVYLALLKLRRTADIRHPKAYLFTVAARLAYRHRQRRDAQPLCIKLDELPTDLPQVAESIPDSNSPEYAAALAERLEALGHRMGELSPRVQSAMLWHLRDGYTCDEVADKLSIVTHRVKKYLVKGLTHCRGAVTEMERTA